MSSNLRHFIDAVSEYNQKTIRAQLSENITPAKAAQAYSKAASLVDPTPKLPQVSPDFDSLGRELDNIKGNLNDLGPLKYKRAVTPQEKTAFKILGIPENASFAEVKMQYRQLVKKLHPDLTFSDPVAQEKVKLVNKAYNILKRRFVSL